MILAQNLLVVIVTFAITLLLAVLLDLWMGEPRRRHPLVAFGRLTNRVEALLRGDDAPMFARVKGVMGVVVLIAPFAAIVHLLDSIPHLNWLTKVFVLYFAIGARSLSAHAKAVSVALAAGDLSLARVDVAKIVSRDTRDMQAPAIVRATIESVLENGNDAIFAAVFWFLVLGAPGAVLYRLANTLDAMWGYKNDRYLHFGWAAARLDDLLNWLPARLTALTYVVLGNSKLAWRCWRNQGACWYSPNAGPVMASGAGALAVQLGGPAVYGGKLKERLQLGEGGDPAVQDIERAIKLVQKGLWLWIILAFLGGLINA